ncbi:MAG: tetratricopeptide repeat protein [Saprospiraceae bacterium]|nr:tetratricopeptide repeat protein [Saprospiraceae bacterium]
MSKRKPSNIKRTPPKAKASPAPISKPSKPKFSLDRESITSSLDPLFQKIFWGLAGFTLIITIILSLGSGINADDEYQNDYSEKLVSYYATMGQDTSALNISKGNMHLYGGFFDLVTGLTNKALGYDTLDRGYHQVRHVYNAIFGVLAMLFVGLMAKEIAGWRAGILALLFIFLSPRFLGHSLMNPKDIPFAAGFAIANYYIILLLKTLPKPKWSTLIGLALGIALALATRAGGLLLLGYLGLFLGLDFLFKHGFKGLSTQSKLVGTYAMYGIGIAVTGYVLAILTWPYALQSPIANPLKALGEFSELGIKIRVLFEGENVMSDKTVWYYPVLWIIKTIPLYVLTGFVGSLILLRSILKKYAPIPVLLMLFASIFPVAYIVYKNSILHDGWRHLMFVYPSMVVMATLFWLVLESFFTKNKVFKYAIYGVLGLLMLESAIFIVRNPHYSYVYFNPIGGGLKGAYGNFETDYWGVSTKQAINWMEKQGIIGDNMQDTVVIGTSFWYPVSRLAGKYGDKVQVKYTRFNNRYSEEWDYGIYPSRYIRGPHLRSDKWPNSRAIYAVKANNVPLTAIEKDADHFAYQGEAAIKAQNWLEATNQLQKEVAAHPDNELAWQSLASVYINTGNFPQAINAANESLRAAPQNETSLYFLGLAYLNTGNTEAGINALKESLDANDENSIVCYYLGVAYQQQQNWAEVVRYALRAIELNQRFKQAYELAAVGFEQQGDAQTAAQYRQVASQL